MITGIFLSFVIIKAFSSPVDGMYVDMYDDDDDNNHTYV